MTKRELFDACNRGPWITTGYDVQYKLIDKTLYFQCSNGKNDWRANFDAAVVPYKDMKDEFLVHRGFLRSWQSVRDEIAALDFNTIVGYSQGAAFALLAHEDCAFKKGYQPVTIVFGCPRVFLHMSKEVKSRFSSVVRHTSKGDIVTMVPPGFQHVGDELVLDKRVKRPAGMPLLQWLSCHTPTMYRLRLE